MILATILAMTTMSSQSNNLTPWQFDCPTGYEPDANPKREQSSLNKRIEFKGLCSLLVAF